MKTYLTGATLVLTDRVVPDAGLVIEDGVIAAICPDGAADAVEVDLGGQWLIPGLVDLHSDAIEKDIEPRPNVRFPFAFAFAQADRRNAAAGVTTSFHALSFAEDEFGIRSAGIARDSAFAIRELAPGGLVDNRVHCRYEITDPNTADAVLELVEAGIAGLVSFMDHTPGQGQFRDMVAYRHYMIGTYGCDDATIEARVAYKRRHAEGAAARVARIAAAARDRGIPLASHDDDDPDRVAAMASLGITISEFPINPVTAQAAAEAGIATLFGAPNVLRGASQSGNMKAREAIAAGVAHGLCSDYAPATMVAAAFRLADSGALPLPEAMRLVSANPAEAAGLTDRGAIALGRRADLAAVAHPGEWPAVTRCWVAGTEVFRAGLPI